MCGEHYTMTTEEMRRLRKHLEKKRKGEHDKDFKVEIVHYSEVGYNENPRDNEEDEP